MAAFSFNAVQHEATDIGALQQKNIHRFPEGDYQAVITDSEKRKTKVETGVPCC